MITRIQGYQYLDIFRHEMRVRWLQVCLEVTSDSASFDLVLEVNNETSAVCSDFRWSRTVGFLAARRIETVQV